jgi:hypothetical protein
MTAALLLAFVLPLSACDPTPAPPAKQAMKRQEYELPPPPEEEVAPTPDPRLGEDGIIMSRAVPERGAPVPIDASPMLEQEHSSTIFVKHSTEQMRAYLKKNFPRHSIEELRGGKSFKVLPPENEADGISLIVNWQGDGYVMLYSDPPTDVYDANSDADGF